MTLSLTLHHKKHPHSFGHGRRYKRPNRKLRFFDLCFSSSERMNSSHFFLVKELKGSEIHQTNIYFFQNFFFNHVNNCSKFKQGGEILDFYTCKIKIPKENKESNENKESKESKESNDEQGKVYLFCGIVFEKRLNITNPKIFEFVYYDFIENWEFTFADYQFLKVKKQDIDDFFDFILQHEYRI